MNLYRNKIRNHKGQTVIETVFMLFILLLIFFMIAEFARAWYLKNSLNNAARVGVRVAAVAIINSVSVTESCSSAGTDEDDPIDAACGASGVPDNTSVLLTVDDTKTADGQASQGENVTMRLTADFATIVPVLLPFMPTSVVAEASMRHE